jgi:hypothetical protein
MRVLLEAKEVFLEAISAFLRLREWFYIVVWARGAL